MPRRPRLLPQRSWRFRVVGYSPTGEVMDMDDVMLEKMGQFVAHRMLMGDPRYKQPISKVKLIDAMGRVVWTKTL